MMLGHEKYTSSSTSKAKRKRGISWAEKSNRLAQQVGRAREAERGAIGELCQPRLNSSDIHIAGATSEIDASGCLVSIYGLVKQFGRISADPTLIQLSWVPTFSCRSEVSRAEVGGRQAQCPSQIFKILKLYIYNLKILV
ncbi:uncharacterized protein LOC116253928 isoform X1 [Nymphaea colorata]|nr:uncharacterized protein LOC116253928 isoform X1 [Nymphaea colorata]